MRSYRGLLAAVVVVVALAVAPAAQAAPITSVYGGAITCTTQASNGNVRACSGFTETFDGTKIDVNVFLPPETGGTEGPYPLIGDFHGWGGAKQGLKEEKNLAGGQVLTQQKDAKVENWAKNGYAVFSMSDRGWGSSCGKYDPDLADPSKCEKGYNHLMDDRYEVRDAQYLISKLAEEGVAEPKEIGATGGSFGGGIAMALAALRNREMLPDGTLVPWESPGGVEMEIAAAVPQYAWSDLAYALLPNGRTLDYVAENPYLGPNGENPIGVEKTSFVAGLLLTGNKLTNYSTTDPEADIPGWYTRLVAGEPYNGDPEAESIIDQVTTYHSSYYIDHAEAPAPLLMQSGWNDDLFPADEALRFYGRTRSQYPSDPISLYFTDVGHQRSQNKEADALAFYARLEAWFAYYLKGLGTAPTSSVQAKTTVCGGASGGPYTADNWNDLSPGEIKLDSAPAQTIAPGAGRAVSGSAFDPIGGTGACASVPAEETSGVANYKLAPAPAGGYTLMGSPTIIADVESAGPDSELAARLLDVSPGGTESLVARGVYRPDAGKVQAVFQLHPNGYHFADGHVAKLELLPSDVPYVRASNLQEPITVSNLQLRLPVVEAPGSLGGLVQAAAPDVVPTGQQLPRDTSGGTPVTPVTKADNGTSTKLAVKIGVGGLSGKISANRKAVIVPIACTGDGPCSGQVMVSAKRSGGKEPLVLGRGTYSLGSGGTANVRLPLTKAGGKYVRGLLAGKGSGAKKLDGLVQLDDSGRPLSLMLKRAVQLPRAH
jgi:predicted acyl esterase